MATVLVTGAGGFIGSNLVVDLLERDFSVRGLDNFATGRRENLDAVRGHERFELLEGDLRDGSTVERAVRDVEVVYHQAAIPSVPRSVEDPRLTTEVNCVGTTTLLEAVRDGRPDRVVVASSSSVYGSGNDPPTTEDLPVQPESPYALSKYFTERLATQYHELHGIETVALRYFNVFGPRQDPSSDYAAVIPKFIDSMIAGDRPTIYGDGTQTRDFTYVDNVVQANRKAAESDAAGAVLNVATGDRVSVNGLVDSINEILGTEIEPRYDDPRPGDVKHSGADISRAKREIDYEPSVDFETGLRRTIEHIRTA